MAYRFLVSQQRIIIILSASFIEGGVSELPKAIVIFDTVFGNTEKIARALASGIEKQGIEVDCVKVDEVMSISWLNMIFWQLADPRTRLAYLNR